MQATLFFKYQLKKFKVCLSITIYYPHTSHILQLDFLYRPMTIASDSCEEPSETTAISNISSKPQKAGLLLVGKSTRSEDFKHSASVARQL